MAKRKLSHEGFIYQVVVGGSTVICITDENEALKYVEEKLHASDFIILPVPVFNYKEVEE